MSSRFARKVSSLVLGVAVLGFALTVSGLAFARPVASEKVPEKIASQDEPRHASDAQGKEKEADPEEALSHSPSVKLIAKVTGLNVYMDDWLSVILNLLLLFVILWIPLRKRLPTFFQGRTEAIQKRLEESRKTTEEARRRLAEVEERLSRLDAEIAQMRNQADAGVQAEEQRVLAAAEEERRRIVQSAEQEIAMAANAARRELKAFAADLAVDLAEKKIQSRTIADAALVHDFATQLGKDGH